MDLFFSCLKGIASALTISSSPLYRYPYRSAAEAFRGDWRRIGKDIDHALQRFDDDRRHYKIPGQKR